MIDSHITTTTLARSLAPVGYKPAPGIPDMFGAFPEEFQALNAGAMNAKSFLERVEQLGYTAAGYDMAPTELWRPAAQQGLRIILTERDSAAAWATSVLNTVASHAGIFSRRPFTFFQMFEIGAPYIEQTMTHYNGGAPAKVLRDRDRERLERVYAEYSRTVKAAVPRKQLLVFNVKHGWQPLCEFLEVAPGSCPTTPFPHVMTSSQMRAFTVLAWALTWVWPLFPLLLLRLVAECLGPSSTSGRVKERRE